MSELKSIVEAYRSEMQSGRAVVLATLVRTSGSTFRHAGARMLLTESDTVIGSVAGGCVERGVLTVAREVLQKRNPVLASFNSISEQDTIFGYGLGCFGSSEIFFERLSPSTPHPLDFISGLFESRTYGAVAVVIDEDAEASLGDFMVLAAPGIWLRAFKEEARAMPFADSVRSTFADWSGTAKAHVLRHGTCTLFVEPVVPPVRLLIFGGGPDAFAVTGFAARLGWDMVVLESRPGRIMKPDRFRDHGANVTLASDFLREESIDNRTFAVVMNHNFLEDAETLGALLPLGLPYIGVMGPKNRTEAMFAGLEVPLPLQARRAGTLHAPVGLDIGGETPDEIAVSIIAEILAVSNERSGAVLGQAKNRAHRVESGLLDSSRHYAPATSSKSNGGITTGSFRP